MQPINDDVNVLAMTLWNNNKLRLNLHCFLVYTLQSMPGGSKVFKFLFSQSLTKMTFDYHVIYATYIYTLAHWLLTWLVMKRKNVKLFVQPLPSIGRALIWSNSCHCTYFGMESVLAHRD